MTITKKEEIQDMIIHYLGNRYKTVKVLEEITNKDFDSIQEICAEFEQDWNSVESDPEGCNSEQDAKLDEILEYHTERLLNL